MSSDSLTEDQKCSQPVTTTEPVNNKEAPLDMDTPPLSSVCCKKSYKNFFLTVFSSH